MAAVAFPMYVGMNQFLRRRRSVSTGVPHVFGDELDLFFPSAVHFLASSSTGGRTMVNPVNVYIDTTSGLTLPNNTQAL